jgi:hypothetical protein
MLFLAGKINGLFHKNGQQRRDAGTASVAVPSAAGPVSPLSGPIPPFTGSPQTPLGRLRRYLAEESPTLKNFAGMVQASNCV